MALQFVMQGQGMCPFQCKIVGLATRNVEELALPLANLLCMIPSISQFSFFVPSLV